MGRLQIARIRRMGPLSTGAHDKRQRDFANAAAAAMLSGPSYSRRRMTQQPSYSPQGGDDKDAFYQEILEGLATYFDSPFLADLLRTVELYPEPYLAHALGKNQLASKKWLLDEVLRAVGPRLGTVYVLGGWKGVLGALLLSDRRFQVDRVLSFDIDPDCEAAADTMNASHVPAGRFKALTADMYTMDYGRGVFAGRDAEGGSLEIEAEPDLVVNTSCEHLDRFGQWYERIPAGTLLALQSNDNFAVDVHVNCVEDLEAFKRQAPMREVLFAGELPRKRYTRFMLIGRK